MQILKKAAIFIVLAFTAAPVMADLFSGTITVDGTSLPIAGDINVAAGTLSIDSFDYQGTTYTLAASEVLAPGSYFRQFTDSTGYLFRRVSTIPAGKVGAYVAYDSPTGGFLIYLAWDTSQDVRGTQYTNFDMSGNKVIGGRFNQKYITMDFLATLTVPYVDVSLAVTGGTVQECSEPGGSTVTIVATPNAQNGGVLDRIDWVVDGVSVGNGASISPFLALGTHTIEATAVEVGGGTLSDSVTVDVNDTTSPVVAINFIDAFGNSVTSAGPGDVTVSIVASDACDPAPVVEPAVTVPTYTIVDGDVLSITSNANNLNLPITAISVSTRATDANGNRGATAFGTLMLQ